MKLFNFLSNDTSLGTSLTSAPSLVQEIHNTFNSRMDEIIKECGIRTSEYDINKELRDRVEKLKSLGFVNSSEVRDLEIVIAKNSEINRLNNQKHQKLMDINYFKQKYPHYKVIDEESLQSICEKYKLMYGAVNFYKGEVPLKNLEDMSKFKIQEEDKLPIRYERGNENYYLSVLDFIAKFNHNATYRKDVLVIAAPSKEFDLSNFSNKKAEEYGKLKSIVDKDPIVMQPVYAPNYLSHGKPYFLIITAWGDEASDVTVVNEKMN